MFCTAATCGGVGDFTRVRDRVGDLNRVRGRVGDLNRVHGRVGDLNRVRGRVGDQHRALQRPGARRLLDEGRHLLLQDRGGAGCRCNPRGSARRHHHLPRAR